LLQQYGDSLISDDRDRRLFGDFRDLSRQYIVEARRVMALAEQDRKEEALAAFKVNIAATGVTLSKTPANGSNITGDLAAARHKPRSWRLKRPARTC
jgi:hypothetical protein